MGVERSRPAIHDWVKKIGLQPASDATPNQIAVDETVIQVDDQRHWLHAAVDPDSNELLHIRLFHTRTTQLTIRFSVSLPTSTISIKPRFSSTMLPISREHSSDSGSDFR